VAVPSYSHPRNGADACVPHICTDHDDVIQYGLVVQLDDAVDGADLIVFRKIACTWTRAATTVTVTCPVDHEMTTLDPFIIRDSSSTRATGEGDAFVLLAPTATTFTYTGVDDGETSGRFHLYQSEDMNSGAAAAGLNLPVNYLDGHWALAILPDAEGVLHVSGNQHAGILWQSQNGQNYIHSDGNWPPVWTDVSHSSTPWYDIAEVGANSYTYNRMTRTPDGVSLWMMDQQDDTYYSRGRDILFWKKEVGVGPLDWTPAAGTDGHFAITEAGTPGVAADRVYVDDVVVQPNGGGDGIHRVWVLLHWRLWDSDGTSGIDPCLVYTDTLGDDTAWRNVDGDAVTMPITWGTRAQCVIPPATTWGSAGGLAIDVDGNPHLYLDNGTARGGTLTSIVNELGATESLIDVNGVIDKGFHAWHDGTTWRTRKIDRIRYDDPLQNPIGPSAPPRFARLGNHMLFMGAADDRMVVRTNGGQVGSQLIKWGPPLHAVITIDSPGQRETWEPFLDPVAEQRGRIEMLIPDGDDPRVVTLTGYQAQPG
jgi:hypothetical protein